MDEPMSQDVRVLLAEVERLRAENSAMREIVRQVANADTASGVLAWTLVIVDNVYASRARALVTQWEPPA